MTNGAQCNHWEGSASTIYFVRAISTVLSQPPATCDFQYTTSVAQTRTEALPSTPNSRHEEAPDDACHGSAKKLWTMLQRASRCARGR